MAHTASHVIVSTNEQSEHHEGASEGCAERKPSVKSPNAEKRGRSEGVGKRTQENDYKQSFSTSARSRLFVSGESRGKARVGEGAALK